MATSKRHSPEQVVRKLATPDRMLGEGKDVADVCRELGVSEQTYYRWRNQFGGLKADDAKRLKDGPELACEAMADWAGERVGLSFIPPGEPWRNGYASRSTAVCATNASTSTSSGP